MRQLRISLTLCLLALVAAATAAAADLNGKWIAQMPARNGETRDITFNFAVNGDQLTGTVTTPRGDAQITDGKVSGDQVTFTEVVQFGEREMKIQYKGTVASDGNSIEFTRSFEGGRGGQGGEGRQGEGRQGGRGGFNRTIVAKRASS